MNEEIIIPTQEEVDPTKVLEDSAEKLEAIAKNLADIFRKGYDAGFLGAKSGALFEAYKQDVKKYVDTKVTEILSDSAEALETLKELSNSLKDSDNVVAGLVSTIAENKVAAEEYTNAEVNKAKTTAQNYTDNAVNQAKTTAKNYTDKSIAGLIDDAPEALDTLKEISNALKEDDNVIAALTKTIADNKTAAETYADDVAETAANDAKEYAKEYVDNEIDKAKLDSADSYMSDYSTNPVQNKVVKNYVDENVLVLEADVLVLEAALYVLFGDSTLGIKYSYDKEDSSYTCCRWNATVKENNIKIAEHILGTPVCKIGAQAFEDNSNLKSITMPDSVTSIEHHAFADCTSLESITIPSSVTSIGNYAFLRCTKLTSVTIPKSLTSIGENAFMDCVYLTDVYYEGSQADRSKISNYSELFSRAPNIHYAM